MNTAYINKEQTGEITWFKACSVTDVPENEGVCVKVNDQQIAIYNFSRRGEWYATDNLCPHKQQMILSRGLLGDQSGEPKVSCPYHKKNFSLATGECLNHEEYKIKTYPVMIKENDILIGVSS